MPKLSVLRCVVPNRHEFTAITISKVAVIQVSLGNTEMWGFNIPFSYNSALI